MVFWFLLTLKKKNRKGKQTKKAFYLCSLLICRNGCRALRWSSSISPLVPEVGAASSPSALEAAEEDELFPSDAHAALTVNPQYVKL